MKVFLATIQFLLSFASSYNSFEGLNAWASIFYHPHIQDPVPLYTAKCNGVQPSCRDLDIHINRICCGLLTSVVLQHKVLHDKACTCLVRVFLMPFAVRDIFDRFPFSISFITSSQNFWHAAITLFLGPRIDQIVPLLHAGHFYYSLHPRPHTDWHLLDLKQSNRWQSTTPRACMHSFAFGLIWVVDILQPVVPVWNGSSHLSQGKFWTFQQDGCFALQIVNNLRDNCVVCTAATAGSKGKR